LFEGQMSSDFLQDLVTSTLAFWTTHFGVHTCLFIKRTLACLRIVIFDICPVCNHIVTEV
jgi:hypothetical protein